MQARDISEGPVLAGDLATPQESASDPPSREASPDEEMADVNEDS